MAMKQLEVKQKTISGTTFYIRPFPAFAAAGISGELVKVLTPILGSLIPILNSGMEEGDDDIDLSNIDVEKALPTVASAVSTLSGDVVESLMKKLMISHKNVSVEYEGEIQDLSMDIANEVFCLDLFGMYKLCWEIITINFGGFFKNLGVQFGSQDGALQVKIPRSENTEPST